MCRLTERFISFQIRCWIIFSLDDMRCVHRCLERNSNSPLQKRERTGTSSLSWLCWRSKHFNWNVTEWKATQPSVRVFSGKLFKWEPRKSCKIPYKPVNPYNFVACVPNPYKLSAILDDIWRAVILPFSSSRYFYSWQRLSNLVDLLFQHHTFPNKRKQLYSFLVLSRFCNGLWAL